MIWDLFRLEPEQFCGACQRAAVRRIKDRFRYLGWPDRAALEQLLRDHKGVLADVARVTKRSRRQVRRWVERFGLNADDFRGKS